MEIHYGVQVLFLGLVLVGVALHFVGWIGLLAFRFRRTPSLDRTASLPGVTIIKPCYSNSDQEEIHFRHFFDQDYPGPVQLLFVVTQESDPIVPIIRSYLKRYPQKDAQLVISKTRNAYWRKVDALYDAHQVAKHEIAIWSDSDAVVRPEYLSQMVASLQEPGISMVTTPQYDVGANNFATALKTLGNNCDVGSYVSIFNLFVKDKRAGFGHSMGFWLKDFKEFEAEAWDTLNNSFADDVVMPNLFTNHRKQVVYRNIYCPVQFSDKSLGEMISQQEKFALCQKSFWGKWTSIFGLLVFPQIWATALVLLAPSSPTSYVAFFGVIGIRTLSSFLFEMLILKTAHMTARYFWTIPLWDVMHIYFVWYSLNHHHVHYHGKTYRFKKGLQLERITESPDQVVQHTGWARPETESAPARFPS